MSVTHYDCIKRKQNKIEFFGQYTDNYKDEIMQHLEYFHEKKTQK